MTPRRGQRHSRARALLHAGDQPPRTDQLGALRQLIVGAERERLDRIEGSFPSAEAMGHALPEAVAWANDSRREALVAALAPSVKAGVREMARKQPDVFGEILAPTIGTAVRRAVADAMAAMLQRMNQVLERGLSLRGIKWRIEAHRSGRPFAEVVLLNTLVYRVERIFLIHTETGLVLEQAAAAGAPAQAPDQVSAMLQALSAFASETFRPASPGAQLRSFEAGDLTVWVERDPVVTLAAVVRGEAPRLLRELLHETVGRIRDLYRDDLAAFQSDASRFRDTRPLLEDCLRQELRPSPRRAQLLLGVLGLALFVLLASVIWTCARHPDSGDERAAYRAALDGAPGVVVTSVERAQDRYRIEGLRDPLAEPVEAIVARAGLPAVELDLRPFYSLDPRIVERRLERALAPPSGVALTFQRGTLRAAGQAPRRWIERSRILGAAIPGVTRYQDAELRSDEDLAALDAAVSALEAAEIDFEPGRFEIAPAERPAAQRAAHLAAQAVEAAGRARVGLCIEIVGHTGKLGRWARNRDLRAARAAAVARALETAGLDPRLLRPRGAGPGDGGTQARRVGFRAVSHVDSGRPLCPQ